MTLKKNNRMKLLGINRMKFTRSKESCSRGGLYKQKNFFGANLFVSILCQDTGGKFLLAKTGRFAESKMPQNW